MSTPPRPGFWKRQFTGAPTRLQTGFDVILGIVLPMICLAADPIVFQGYDGFVTHYRKLAYSFVGLEFVILGAWLVLRHRLASSAAFFAGPLLAGSLFAFALGLGMLPLTFIGMLVLIGFLGWTPFFTAFVFLRNGLRAHAQSRPLGRGARIAIVLAGILFVGTPPLMVLKTEHGRTLPEFLKEAWSGRGYYPRDGGLRD